MYRLAFLIAFCLIGALSYAQITVTGTVVYKKGRRDAAPGVSVIEKGTTNGTLTQSDGTFSFGVSSPQAVLVFCFVGVITQEVPLNARNNIRIELEEDCNKDFFDSQQLELYASSGAINTPVGGQIRFAAPWIWRGVVKGEYRYQTDLDENAFHNVDVELSHYIANCDYDIDFRWSQRQVSFQNDFESLINSFETNVNLRPIRLILGYAHYNIWKGESARRKFSGVLIGVERYFNLPLYPMATVKVALSEDQVEYQASVQGGYRRFGYFVKFYKLDEFSEVSVGVGARLGYKIKRQKK